MSILERLHIRGIRNFGTDAEDEQRVEFTTPLTLIVGQNGSGKTTIIESIKYALTGKTPKNCGRGSAFINSPDVNHRTESVGQVKLHVKDLQGKGTTISRSAKVLRKNKKQELTFESIEAITTNIRWSNEEGQPPKSIIKRIDDATDDMCIAMGVPKAIINHVLFCHQEEANWPLGTDAEVKNIFEKIFDTTKYNNALEKIRKLHKDLKDDLKNKQVILKEMEMIKQEADKQNIDINKYVDEKQQMEEKYQQCDVKLQPLRDEYKKVTEIGDRLSSITASKTKAETELKNEQDNAQKLSSKIKNIFTGSETELQEEIKVFNRRRLQKQSEMEDKEMELGGAQADRDVISKKVDKCDRDYHLLLKDREREQDLYDDKATFIQKMCKNLNINVDFDIRNSNDRASGLVVNIKTALRKVEDDIKQIVANNDKIDAEQEKEIRTHREEEVRIKSEITSTVKQLTDSEQALIKQKDELKKIEHSDNKLKVNRTQIAKIKTTCDQLVANNNTQGLRAEITEHRDEKQNLSDSLDDIDMQITSISTMAALLADVTSKEKHIEKRESEVRRIKNKHFDSFQRLFPNESIESGIKRKIEALSQELRMLTNRLDAEIRLKENHVLANKNQLQNKKQDLIKYENDLRRSEEEIDRECEQMPFDEVMATTKERVDKYQMEYSAFKSSDVFYKNYIKKMADQPCCPLCHKDLDRNEVGDLTTELSDKIENLPTDIDRSESLLKESQLKLERLIGMRSTVEKIENLKSSLIPQIKEDIGKIEKDLLTAQEKIKQAKRDVEEPREKMNLITSTMVGDMSVLEEALRDIEQTRTDLEPLRRKMPSGEGQDDYNLDSLQKKRKEITERIKSLDRDIVRKEKQCDDEAQRIRQLKDKEIELKGIELQLQGDIQKSDGLKAREKELIEDIRKLKEKKEASNQLLIPIQGKIKHAEEKRRNKKKEGAEVLDKETKRYDGLKRDMDGIDRVSKELERLAEQNLTREIERYKKELIKLREEQSKQVAVIESIREEIKALTKEQADQQNAERELNDNLELKRIQKKVLEKENELDTLRKHEREVDFNQIIEKKAQLTCDMKNIKSDRIRMSGQMEEKQAIIDNLRAETNKPKYRDSVRNYKKAYYENIVLTKSIADLATYCETLEKVLTNFHSDKMEEINSLIRDLWRTIYKGNDIDYIQINTEETTGTTKRRSYTYRVVACKNDSLMDFRGQSSAGQRVLACLIIRIALAETFSGRCGVLALDEPTTNLDQLNIEALCEALNGIVEERGGEDKFMLIVITHDEGFINSMGRVSSYYRVSRDNNGKSRIQKVNVN